MDLPSTVAIKLNTYTLFCHQLLRNLNALKQATRADLRLRASDCLDRFDDSLRVFFIEASPYDFKQAISELGAALRGRVALFRAQNAQAAAVFDQIINAATTSIPTWRYQQDLEALHKQGRTLAHLFYVNSPWLVTQSRLSRTAELVFRYGSDEHRQSHKAFGYHPVPLAFRGQYPNEETSKEMESVILVYFAFDRDSKLYMAYPYLFMHEFVSHIFALDHENERFNDGWLLYVAEKHLIRQWRNLSPPLIREQVYAFEDNLYGSLNPIPREACRFARDFDNWLGDDQRFLEITWELAAFEPRGGESDFWPDEFINRLEQEFEVNRSRLRRKINNTTNVRELYNVLSPP